METFKRITICSLFVAFIIDVLLILTLCIPDTQFSLPTNRMIIYPLVCCLGFSASAFILSKISFINDSTAKWQLKLLIVYLLGYSVLLYLCSTKLDCIPMPLRDHAIVRNQALYMAGLSDASDWEYFACHSNNTPPCVILSWILRLGNLLQMKNPVHLAFILNILQIDIAILCIYRLIIMFCQSDLKYALAWVGAGMMSVNLAAIGHTQSTYTDAMSLCFGILAFYIWCHIHKAQQNSKKVVLALFAGVCWGIGASIKMTVLISFFAVVCYVIFCSSIKKDFLYLLSAILAIAVIFACFAAYTNTLPCAELEAEYGYPKLIYWLAVGMKGDGSYLQNGEYILLLLRTQGLAARQNASLQYVADNIHEFGNIIHIIQKVKCNFAFGTFASESFVEICEEKNIFYEIFALEGEYFKRYAMAATSYFYSLLILFALGITSVIYRIHKTHAYNQLHVVTIFTTIGIMIYIMIFEANNRQLYNHIPWFVLGAIIGIESIITIFNHIIRLVRR